MLRKRYNLILNKYSVRHPRMTDAKNNQTWLKE